MGGFLPPAQIPGASYSGVMLGLVYTQEPAGPAPNVFASAGITPATIAALAYTHIGVGQGLLTVGNAIASFMIFTTNIARAAGPVAGYNMQYAGIGGGGTGWLLNLYNGAGALVDEVTTAIWVLGLADASNGPF